MDQIFATRAWLEWLARVRLLTITLILTVAIVWPQYVPGLSANRFFLTLIVSWITLGILHLILLRWLPQAPWHGGVQVAGDVVMVTLLVYLTGSQESYFISLYLLVIIVGSIVFSRRVAFINAAICFSLLAAMTLLAFTGKLPRTSTALPPVENLRTWLVMNLLGFLAVAYLASLLVHSLRSKGRELEEKREELLSLQDFTQDIIHSMRGGLITTDLSGGILLLNRTGEEILGHRFADVRGKKLQELNQDFWLPGQYPNVERLSLRREIDFRTPQGEVRYLGISVSPLRLGMEERSGFVFNFQDLTELRRLEQEVATKERMAALGRLSAAIAHEIRQPLTAMAGAVKELGRMVPLEEDEKHLVNIVSRESERLNRIITDFLNYSREKSYEFREEDVRTLLDDALTLMEKNPEVGGKYQIERAYNGKAIRARVDSSKIKQVFWNLGDNALRAMPEGGKLTVRLEERP